MRGASAKIGYDCIARQVITPTGPEEPVVVPPALVERTLELLMLHCTSDEEAVRNVVADCLGKLTLLDAARLIPALQGRLTDTSANARATMVLSLKCCITDKPQPVDAALAPALEKFLLRMEDDDRHVRRAAVQVLNVGAHNKASLIQGLLPTLMPLLYQQTVQRPDLVRVVDLGPFKHTVDDGLELRKSAFECLDTLLDSSLDYLDAAEFLKHLQVLTPRLARLCAVAARGFCRAKTCAGFLYTPRQSPRNTPEFHHGLSQ